MVETVETGNRRTRCIVPGTIWRTARIASARDLEVLFERLRGQIAPLYEEKNIVVID